MSEQRQQKYPPSVQHGIPRLSVVQKGWKSAEIGKLVMEVVRPVEMDDDETYTLVTAKRSRGGIVRREKLKGYEIAVKNQFYIQAGDFIISKRQIVHGACGFVPEELDGAIVSNEYLVLNFTDKVIPQFWELLTHTVYFQQVCFHSSIGVHVEKMLFKVSRWYQWKMNIPTLKEQEKIASFLGAIDTRLTQLRRKHELLRTYKWGVMRKLFSQEIHFPKFKRKWNQLLIEDIASVSSGGTPERSASRYWNGDIPWVTTSEIGQRVIEKSAEKISLEGLQNSSAKIFQRDTILLAMYGQGKTRGQVSILNIEASTNQACAGIVTNKDYNPRFLYYFLFGEYEKLRKLSNDGSQKNLSSGLIKKYKVPNACLEEQKEIVDFLTAIDKKIEEISQQINLTEQFKKGLLQKMFV